MTKRQSGRIRSLLRRSGAAAHGEPIKPGDEEATYRRLRTMALGSVEVGLAAPPATRPDVSGVIVDVGSSGGFATFVALTDNTASMYTSTGGGVIGAGSHEPAISAVQDLLEVAQAHLGSFKQKDDRGLPAPGSVRFHVLSLGGSRSEDVPDDSFWGKSPHVLMPVIAATQNLVSAIQMVSPPP